jgi:hypothetical protein
MSDLAMLSFGFTEASGTVTETVSGFNSSTTLDFTAEAGNPSVYQLSSVSHGSFTFSPESDLTYGFTFGSGAASETITSATATLSLQFTAEAGSSTLYQISSETLAITNPSASLPNGGSLSYSFSESNGTVTAMSETVTAGSYSHSFNLLLIPGSVFGLASGSVTESFVSGNQVETIDFVSSGSGYVVAKITAAFIAEGSATTALDVNPFDRAQFTIVTSLNTGGTVTSVESVSPTGTLTPITPGSHVSFIALAGGFVEETVTFGSHSNYAVFYEAGGASTYMEVAHGSGTTVDLVGLKAQLAELPAAIGALV